MKALARYSGLFIFNALAIFSSIWTFKTLFTGQMYLTNATTTHVTSLSRDSLGILFYLIPIIQALLAYILFLLGYGFYLEIKPHWDHKKIGPRKSAFEVEFDPIKITTSQLKELLFAFSGTAKEKRKTAGEMLKTISIAKPNKLYQKMDFFFHFLDNKNKILRTYAADIIANLTSVDKNNVFDKHMTKYMKLIKQNKNDVHMQRNAMKIAENKPRLKKKIIAAIRVSKKIKK